MSKNGNDVIDIYRRQRHAVKSSHHSSICHHPDFDTLFRTLRCGGNTNHIEYKDSFLPKFLVVKVPGNVGGLVKAAQGLQRLLPLAVVFLHLEITIDTTGLRVTHCLNANLFQEI